MRVGPDTPRKAKRERVLPGARVVLGLRWRDGEKVELKQMVNRVWLGGATACGRKPLDGNAFLTLIKTAKESVLRHHQQLQASLHQSVTVMAKTPGAAGAQRITVKLDIATDDDAASAQLSAVDDAGEVLAQLRVAPNHKLTRASAEAWVVSGFVSLLL